MTRAAHEDLEKEEPMPDEPSSLRSRNDPFQFKYATEQKRTLITTNQSDFRLLHRFHVTMQVWEVLSSPHHGILATAVCGVSRKKSG